MCGLELTYKTIGFTPDGFYCPFTQQICYPVFAFPIVLCLVF